MSVAERFSIVPWPSSQLAACHHIQLVSVNQLLENEQAVLDTTGFLLLVIMLMMIMMTMVMTMMEMVMMKISCLI